MTEARQPKPAFPNSTQLIEMAHTEWKNREERRGIHNEQDFCAGWISGYLSRPHTPAPKFTSEDLILLAHDEWKRREERKHLYPEQDWVAGFLSGFCTSRRWAREYVDKLRQQGDEQR